jgi:hypothetical protein
VVSTCQWYLLWKIAYLVPFMLAWIYPNQLLIYSRNIPYLSNMCKCGLDMSVISALKNDLFGAFHVGVDLSKPTIYIFEKYSKFIKHVHIVVSTYRWHLLWRMTYLVSFHVGVDLSKPTINIFAKYPNLSSMCKCGLDMSVTSALKNDLFSVFHVFVNLFETNTNMFAKYS